jgi:hypothetical protein
MPIAHGKFCFLGGVVEKRQHLKEGEGQPACLLTPLPPGRQLHYQCSTGLSDVEISTSSNFSVTAGDLFKVSLK